MGVHPSRMSVVPVGVDHTVFRPRPDRPTVPGRIMVTSSSDVPMKGLVPLLEAVAKLRTERDVELLVIGRPREGGRVAQIDRAARARVLCHVRERHGRRRARGALRGGAGGGRARPSTRDSRCRRSRRWHAGCRSSQRPAGHCPRWSGRDGETGLLVTPDDPGALASAIARILDDPVLADRLGRGGRERVLGRFTWRATAEGTAEQYRIALEEHKRHPGRPQRLRAEHYTGRRDVPWPVNDGSARSGAMLTVDYGKLEMHEGERLLDLGCGGGRHAFEAARRGARVVALDAGTDEVAKVRDTLGAMLDAGEIGDPEGYRCGPGRRAEASLPRRRVRPGDRCRGARAHPRRHRRDVASWSGCFAPVGSWRSRSRASDPSSSTGPCRTSTTTSLAATCASTGAQSSSDGSKRAGLRLVGSHHAHSLHSPYWWLRCAVGPKREDNPFVKAYHRMLVWDITRAPWVTRTADRMLNPVLGKSLVVYARKPS